INNDILGTARPTPGSSSPDMGAYENSLGAPITNFGSGLFSVQGQRLRAVTGNPVDPGVANEAAYRISGNQITIEAWFYPVRPIPDGEIYHIAGYGGNDHPYMLRMLGTPSGAEYDIQITDGSQWIRAFSTNVDVAYNTWTHLAGTYDGTTLRLYVNGVESPNSTTPSPPITNISTNGFGLYVGRRVDVPSYGGLIDELRLWNVARTSIEINNSMAETLSGTEPDLVGYWPLNEISPNYSTAVDPLTGEVGRVVEDKTSNGNHLWAQWGADIHSGIFQDGTNEFEPFLISPGEFEIVMGDYISFYPLAGGGGATTISLIGSPPAGMAYDAGTNELSWMPVAGQIGYQTFILEATNGSGSAQQDYTIWVEEYAINFADHNNNYTLFSAFNDGSVGVDAQRGIGNGFAFVGDNALYEGSLIVSTAANGLISTSAYGDKDFATRSDVFGIESDLPGFDQAYQSEFDDTRSTDPIGVRVVQQSHSKASAPDDDYVILTYDIENTSGGALTGVSVALWMDWDVGDWWINRGGYDDSRDLIYTYEDQTASVPPAERSPSLLEPDALAVQKHSSKMAGDSPPTTDQTNPKYYGAVVLQGQVTGRSVGQIGYSDSDLLGHLDVYGETPPTPDDMRSIIVVGVGDIPIGGTVKVAFAVLGGNDLGDLQANADAAQTAFSPTQVPIANTGSGLFVDDRQRFRVRNIAPVEPAIADTTAYQISGNQITLEAWVYPVRPLAEGEVFNLAGYHNSAEPAYMLSMRGDAAGGQYRFQISDGTNMWYVMSPSPDVVYNTWTHLAGTYDGNTNELRLYVNGVERWNFSPNPPVAGLDPTGIGFYIGRIVDSPSFGGLIDEVRLWDYARTGGDINTYMDNTLTGAEPGLRGYWPLNEFSPDFATYVDPLGGWGVTGRVLEDKSGNGNHLWAQYDANVHSGIFQDGANEFEPFVVIPIRNFRAVVGEYFSFDPLGGGNGPGGAVEPTFNVLSSIGAEYNPANGLIEWIPGEGQDGYQTITLEAINNAGTSAPGDIGVYVREYPIDLVSHTNSTQMSVFNDGHLGARRGVSGSGFSHGGENGLFEAGLVLIKETGEVLHASDYNFATRSLVSPTTSPIPGYEANVSIYDDSKAGSPLDVGIRQISSSSTVGQANEFVIVNFEVHNFSGADLIDVYVGVYADWDIGDDAGQNTGGYDAVRRLVYTYDAVTTGMHSYYGVAAMNPELSGAVAGNQDIYLTEVVWNNRNVIDDGAGLVADIRTLVTVGPFTIPVDDKISKAFAFVGGSDQAALFSNTSAAQTAYGSYVELVPPAIPTGFFVTAFNGYIRLDWDENVESNMDHYSVYRSTDPSDPDPEWIDDVNHPINWYNDLDVSTGTPYYYWVSAEDDGFLESDPNGPVYAMATGSLVHEGSDGTFGYSWQTNFASGGPSFEWYDISTVGTEHASIGDEGWESVTLPWDFPFYGLNENQFRITGNGYILFGPSQPDWNNQNIPDPAEPNHLIAPFWFDLDPSAGGSIYSYDDATNGRFIVQWDWVPPYTSAGTSPPAGADALASAMYAAKAAAASTFSVGDYTFQLRLYQNGNMEFAYQSMTEITDFATVGIENNNGSDGLAIVYNSVLLQDGMQINIYAPAQVVDQPTNFTATPQDGSVSLSWQHPGADHFKIYWHTGFTPNFANTGTPIIVNTGNAYTHTDLTNDTQYNYWIVAVDGGGIVSDVVGPQSATPQSVGGGFWVQATGASDITGNTATLWADVMPDGNETAVSFELWDDNDWAYVRELGVAGSPFYGMEIQPFSTSLYDLTPGHTYHFQAKAVQSGFSPMFSNQVMFSTPTGNETIDVQAITETGVVEFTATGISLDIGAFGGSPDATVEVTLIAAAPTGAIPGTLQLLTTTTSWQFEATNLGSFDMDITFALGAGDVSVYYQNNPGDIKLLSRPSGSSSAVAWTVRTAAVSATHQSVTFPNITTFSEFTLGTTDSQPPAITNADIPTQAVALDDPLTISVSVYDDSQVDVELRYLVGGASNPTVLSMNEDSPGQFSREIPGSDVTLTGLLVQILAVDAALNSDTTAPVSVSVSYPDDVLSTSISDSRYPNGLAEETWLLMAVPGFLNDRSTNVNFRDELSDQDDYVWKVLRYSGGGYSKANNLNAGAGYWIYHRGGMTYHFNMTAGETRNLDGQNLQLVPGWNLIGNPFPFDLTVQFDQADYYGPVTRQGGGWTGAQTQITLQPWAGYAVYNRGAVTETVTLSVSSGQQLLAKEIVEPEPVDGWLVHLAARGRDYSDVNSAVGRVRGAGEQLDRYDNPEPPTMGGYVSLVMDRPEWGARQATFSTDVRSLDETDGTWDVQLRTKDANGPIALSYEFEGDFPAGNRVVLM
ncbi:MAG: LamG-like jellyroll fold domain-containing protein, partial [Candidatus Neomarinimicrobiota bacterium]